MFETHAAQSFRQVGIRKLREILLDEDRALALRTLSGIVRQD
jgi:hypothetical protein